MSVEGEGVTIEELPADEVAPAEPTVTAEPEAAAAGETAAPASVLDSLLAGQDVPDDVAFYAQQAEEAETAFTADDIAALPTKAKLILGTILARTKAGAAKVAEVGTEVDAKVSEAKAALLRAQEERARALDWTKGQQVSAQREQVQRVLAQPAPNAADPDFAQRMIERTVAAKMAEFFASIDNDAQAREQQVQQAQLDQGYEAYRKAYDDFRAAHADELVVAGQKETVTRWTTDAQGNRVQRQFVTDKRSPLAVRIEQVLDRYGPDPADGRRYRMGWQEAYTLALNELSAEGDRNEHEESMKRARERVVRPAARQAPPVRPPIEDSEAFAAFLVNNPDWVADKNRALGG